MNKTIRIILVTFGLLSINFSQSLRQVRPESVGLSSDRLDRLTTQLDSYVANKQIAGSVTLVLRKGKIAYSHANGFRDVATKDLMVSSDLFRIASQTKAIISVCIMILQEKGDLLISDPVGKYIHEYNVTTVAEKMDDGYKIVPANRKITIRDLLTHTAGVGWGFGPAQDKWEEAEIMGWYFAHKSESILETIRRVAALPMDAHPGDKYVYGLSTDILGAVIEIVSGQPLDQFLKEEIFNPLQMDDTHFYMPKQKRERLATVYSSSEEGITLSPDPGERVGAGMIGQGHYVKGPQQSFSGGAGLISTAKDYATFLQMMLNGGFFNHKRILSRKSVELMTVNHLQSVIFPWTDGTGFGLGFYVLEDLGDRGQLGSEGEYGWGGAYHSTYWVDPKEELVVVYFTQLIPAINIDDHQKLRSLIYQSIID